MSNNDQNSEVLNLLQSLATKVDILTTDMQWVKNNQQALAVSQQAFATDLQEVKADVREIKSWARVTDNRLDNMENKLVDFATQLSNLDEKVDARLHDTRPMWRDLNLRLDIMEAELAIIKANQAKSDEIAQLFRQELISRFRQLEKDLNFYRKHVQVDVAALAKDIIDLEERLEKVESKLEIKN